ncbi:MAG: hypothetical protein F6K50_28095 [Moorea sp. SIO3I7]|nr:hypothetical protein [Moorena sp. SIO3I7]NEO66438.1 hypothetical protein [Moorena sp. SIO4G2]
MGNRQFKATPAYSLLLTPYSLLPTPYSLFPIPCSLFPLLFDINQSGIV